MIGLHSWWIRGFRKSDLFILEDFRSKPQDKSVGVYRTCEMARGHERLFVLLRQKNPWMFLSSSATAWRHYFVAAHDWGSFEKVIRLSAWVVGVYLQSSASSSLPRDAQSHRSYIGYSINDRLHKVLHSKWHIIRPSEQNENCNRHRGAAGQEPYCPGHRTGSGRVAMPSTMCVRMCVCCSRPCLL